MSASQPHIAIIGAGIIGLSCAWELSRRGAKVTVYEKNWPPRGASWAAAGMLAPAYEAAAEDGVNPRLFDLCMESAQMWAGFAADLEAASGMNVGHEAGPSLAVAVDPDQARRIAALREALDERRVAHERLTPDEARRVEPQLTDKLLAAVLLPTDGQIDNRRVVEALIEACRQAGAAFKQSLFGFHHDDGRIEYSTEADHFLIAAGADRHGPDVIMVDPNDQVGYLSSYLPWAKALQPVKGQALSVARLSGDPEKVVRAGGVYCVPKSDRLIIGATVEHGAFRPGTRDADILTLQALAATLLPCLAERDVIEQWAGFRPHSSSGGPLLGLAQDDRLWVASGHYRNGILLAPVTAKIMADMILDGHVSELAAAFSPSRFTSATA